MRFREHRGQFEDSMKTMVELADFAAVVAYIAKLLYPWNVDVEEKDVHTRVYLDRTDTRNGWAKTYLVVVPSFGVVGYTDEAPTGTPEKKPPQRH